MKKPQHIQMNSIPLEDAHGGEGSRRLILKAGEDISQNLEAFANTFLPEGGQFGWHGHDELDEIMVCLSGKGVIEFETGEKFNFGERDLVYIPKGVRHTISSPESITEYFFIRIN